MSSFSRISLEKPVTLSKTTSMEVNFYNVSVIRVELDVSAMLEIGILDYSGNLLKICHHTITGDDYSNWGTDDSYIKKYVADNLETIFNA